MLKTSLFFVVMLLAFSGCQNKSATKKNIILTNAILEKTTWSNIDGFADDNLTLALEVFQKDCQAKRVNKLLKEVCKKSFEATNAEEFFISNFTPYKLLNKNKTDTGLITGYYEPILNGSFTKTDIYKYPIYQRPDNLVDIKLGSIYPELNKYTLRGKVVGHSVIPYDTREEINQNDKNLNPLLYVDNKVDKFFLEIQGSGKIRLPNGEIINIGYSDQNGRKYFPIGRKFIQDSLIPKENISLQSMKIYLEEHPKQLDEILNLNPSVVFFHKTKKNATGSLGVPLIAQRNMAIDRSIIPLGFPIFLNTTDPLSNDKISSLMIAADTGGAIKGQIRADYFWGNGNIAKQKAGKMAQKGKLTILVPNLKKKMFWSNDTTGYIKVKKRTNFMIEKHITNTISNYFYKFATTSFPTFVQNIINSGYVKILGLDMKEFRTPSSYKTLNELFTRELVIHRSFDKSLSSFISPADSFVSEAGDIHNDTALQIKGMSYSVKELLTDNISSENQQKVLNGTFMNFYLSPKDYHRYHAAMNCKITKLIHVPGKLYPVNFTYLNKQQDLFIENERVILECLDENNKLFYMVFVGALNVGKMVFAFEPRVETNSDTREIKVYEYDNLEVKKGDCLGYFKMGSTVVMLWENNFVNLENLVNHKVRFGSIVANTKQ